MFIYCCYYWMAVEQLSKLHCHVAAVDFTLISICTRSRGGAAGETSADLHFLEPKVMKSIKFNCRSVPRLLQLH